jgi:hypothetical protein
MSDLAPFHVNVEGKYIVEDASLSRGRGYYIAWTTADHTPTPPNPPSGPMTRARAKALQHQVNSIYM